MFMSPNTIAPPVSNHPSFGGHLQEVVAYKRSDHRGLMLDSLVCGSFGGRNSYNKMPLMTLHGMLNVASFIRIVCFGDF